MTALHLHTNQKVWLPASAGFHAIVPGSPTIADPERRAAGKKHLRAFKKLYFPWLDDTGSHFHGDYLDLLNDLIHSKGILNQSIAAKRGIGKTFDTVIGVIYAKFYRFRRYPGWICRKIDFAYDRIDREAHQILYNELLQADFPELCAPFIGVDVRQVKAPLAMTKSELYLPNHTCTRAFSIESASRGLALADGTRPDLILLDDVIETILGSEVETENLTQLIESLAGLPESGGNMVTLMQLTVPQVGGVGDIYTDSLKKPGWNGKRWRTMMSAPLETDKWERFKELCNLPPETSVNGEQTEHEKLLAYEAVNPLDVAAIIDMPRDEWDSINISGKRHALYYYAANKSAMDAGVVMVDRRSPVYEYYATMVYSSHEFVAGEWDQHPIKSERNQVTQLKIEHLLPRRIGPKQGVCPEWTQVLVCGIDVNKPGLHWEVNAFGRNGEWCLVDQGEQSTNLKEQNFKMVDDADRKNKILEFALTEALEKIKQHTLKGYANEASGELLFPALYGPDVGGTDGNVAWAPVIIAYCNKAENLKRWRPMKGLRWTASMVSRTQAAGIINGQWERMEKNNPGGVIHRNADYWKSKVEESSTMEPLDGDGKIRPGARIFHQQTPRVYLHHQCNEFFLEALADDAKNAKALKPGWNPLNGPNDWFDTAAESRCLYDIWKWERRKAAQQGQQRRYVEAPKERATMHNPMYS